MANAKSAKAKSKSQTKSTAKPAAKKILKIVPKKAAPKKAAAAKSVTKASASKVSATKSSSKPNNSSAPAKSGGPGKKSGGPTKPTGDVIGIHRFKPLTSIPDDYKPSDKEPYMNIKQLEYFRRKLVAWREELLKESNETLDHLKEENWNESDITDRATVETDAALELRTRDRYRKLINKIDAALRRIESGEYGYCEETGDPIGLKRLEARAIATLSIAAQERHERDEKQYSDD